VVLRASRRLPWDQSNCFDSYSQISELFCQLRKVFQMPNFCTVTTRSRSYANSYLQNWNRIHVKDRIQGFDLGLFRANVRGIAMLSVLIYLGPTHSPSRQITIVSTGKNPDPNSESPLPCWRSLCTDIRHSGRWPPGIYISRVTGYDEWQRTVHREQSDLGCILVARVDFS
jgi:hypothetical protein